MMLFKDRSVFHNVSVSGDVFVRNQLSIGNVNFQQDDCQGNPVLAYLQRPVTPQGLPTPLANEVYTFRHVEGSSTFNAPLTNELYSKVSGDFNPIHVNPYFSDYAFLPTTITHGVLLLVAMSKMSSLKAIPTVLAYNFLFVDMVLPNDQLEAKLKHICM
jgi:fatty acid synthase subunit alpha